MSRTSRQWTGRLVVTVLAAAGVNVVLSGLSVRHDATLVALVAVASVAVGVLALEALDTPTRLPWRARRPDARPDRGEDTRTTMYRHVVEAHLTSRHADEAVVWKLADLARQRLRQVHGFRPEDDPARTEELLGAQLTEWMSHDRRHRYTPDERHRRYTVDVLSDAVRRIEQL
jgi:hypothetical protein